MQLDDIAANARALRRGLGLSQEQLAAASGFDVSLIASLERARTVLPISALSRVADALGVSPAALLRPGLGAAEDVARDPEPPASGAPDGSA